MPLLIAALVLCTERADALVVAERGRPADCSIVLPASAGPSYLRAAGELRDHVRRMTGVELPIGGNSARQVVLESAPVDSDGDGFSLRVSGNSLHVSGGSRGILHGVYELLETYGGCGWFSPTCEVVPKVERFAVPDDLNVTEHPAFSLRELLWFCSYDGAYAAKLRLNGRAQRRTAEWGGISNRFAEALGNCHTFYRLVPPERYFAAHPEYFSLVKGKRMCETAQLCLTNPDVLAIATSNVLEAIRHEPDAKYFGVSQNDCLGYCECPACKAVDDEEGSHSGTVIRFVNAIAAAVEQKHPDKIVSTLAYTYSRKPPKKTRVRHNVMPILCVIECDYARPIPDSDQPETMEFANYFRDWSAQTDMLYVWDYTTNFRHYLHAFPNVCALQGNLGFFRDNHVVSVFAQGGYQGGHADFAELKTWLLAKWMWNPNLEMKPLLDRFFAGYYGKAAPFVRTYFEELHALQRKDPRPLKIYDDPSDSCMDDAFLARAADLWRQAAEAVKGDPVRAENVRMGALSTDYTRVCRWTRPLDASTGQRTGRIANVRGLAKDMLDCIARGNVRVAEKQYDHDAFIRRLEVLAHAPTSADGRDGRVSAPATMLHATDVSSAFVDDPLSGEGKSLKLPNTHHEWFIRYPLNELGYDSGEQYVLRVRMRVERKGSEPVGNVLGAGVYDPVAKKSLCRDLVVRSDASGAGWSWFETEPFVPNDHAYVWISPGLFNDAKDKVNPAMEAAYLDRFEFVRQRPPVSSRHLPKKLMGRDYYTALYPHYDHAAWNAAWACGAQRTRFDNPEVSALDVFREAVPVYHAQRRPPPAEMGLAAWRTLSENFEEGEPDAEILSGNPKADRPLIVGFGSKRDVTGCGGRIDVDADEWRAWRAAHTNLLCCWSHIEWDNAVPLLYAQAPQIRDVKRRAEVQDFLGRCPTNRIERMEVQRRYFDRMCDLYYGDREVSGVMFASLYTGHLAAQYGAKTLIVETTNTSEGDFEYRWNVSAMFARGAARQFDLPWEWYVAVYMNGWTSDGRWWNNVECVYPWARGAKPVMTKDYKTGPDFGVSRSLQRRAWYFAYLNGANLVEQEEWSAMLMRWDDELGKTVLSERGKDFAAYHAFTRAHPDRGALFAPVAILVPVGQGYPTYGGYPWNNSSYGYSAGDHEVDAVFFTLVPGFARAEAMKRGEERNLCNSPFAQMYDVVSPDAGQDPKSLLRVLSDYRALVVAGDYPGQSFEPTLRRYEANGGRVVRLGRNLVPDPSAGSVARIRRGEETFPELAKVFSEFQDSYFPFRVTGDCLYGANKTESGWWLWIFNNCGVMKFADQPQVLDERAAARIVVDIARAEGVSVRELISGTDVFVHDARFERVIGPGDLAVFEIKD